MPDLKIDFYLLRNAEKTAVRESAGKLLRKITRKSSSSIHSRLWPVANGKSYEQLDPSLVVAPLDRIGGEPGKSGSTVLSAYFLSVKGGHTTTSFPLVIKIGCRHTLKTEEKNAESVLRSLQYQQEAFALPIQFNTYPKLGILWTPFISGNSLQPPQNGHFLNLWTRNYLDVLRANSQCDEQKTLLEKAFKILNDIHGHSPRNQMKNLIKEYKPYLRGIEDAKLWGKEWKALWGPKSEEKSWDLGRTWTNPFWVLSKLSQMEQQPLCCGTIHGDLHPRNIVLTDEGLPRLIDFGWAQENAHIAKDYALLECNLRFVALRPDVPIRDLEAMARWVGLNQRPPRVESSYCRERVSLIESFRQIVKAKFGEDLEDEREYSWSLFLIALGLLKHIRHFDNQIAARLTVLSLASYVAKNTWRDN